MLKKIGLISIANAVTSLGGYLLLPIYLSLMTQEEFGEFSFIVSVMGSLSLLVGLSLYVPFIRNFCADTSNDLTRSELVSTIFNSLLFGYLLLIYFCS